jgi:hypothetical protein
MQHLTIFGLIAILTCLVFFRSLPLRASDNTSQEGTRISSSETQIETKPSALRWDYEAMTLPCVKVQTFAKALARKKPKQLNMTLTLMPGQPGNDAFTVSFDCLPGRRARWNHFTRASILLTSQR